MSPARDSNPDENLAMDHAGHHHPSTPDTGAHAPSQHDTAERAPRAEHGHHAHMVADFRQRFWISLVLTVPILALSPMFLAFFGVTRTLAFPGDRYLLFALSSVVYFYGGWPFLKGFGEEAKKRQPGMMTLIAVAISAAYFYSAAVIFGLPGMDFFWELATLIDIMLLGHWLEMRSVMGASGALEALVRLLPADAHRLGHDGAVEDVPVSALTVGDRVLIRPGEKVPTDGVILEGDTTLNESMLTGESRPVEKGVGNDVIGGAVNGEGAVTIEVRKTGNQTYLAQVMAMVRKAQESKSRTQDIANRAATWLTIVALGGGALSLLAWSLLQGDFAFAMERAVTVMVISCPHALGLAVPLVVAVSTTLSARSGLLIRDRAAFERARDLDAVVFDKTGTLTEGRFGVTDVATLADLSEAEVLRLAAALEGQSEHPIAAGIARVAQERGLDLPTVSAFRSLPGRGVEAQVEGRIVRVVSPGYLRDRNIPVDHVQVNGLAKQGKTIVYVLLAERVIGAIALADIVRPESREALQRLKRMGIQCMMLTGDAEAVARTVAADLRLDAYFAEVLPEEKAEKIKGIKRQGLRVAMVGDGVNDAPALVEADLGIAIGAGTDVAIESADVILVRDDPRDVADILGLSRRTYSKMVQNLWWAAGYNIVAIPLAAGVAAPWGLVLSPAMGAVLMSLSTIIVALNAQLMSRTPVGHRTA